MALGKGRIPKSAAARRAGGVAGHRPVKEDIIAPSGAPEKPADLSAEASLEWDLVIDEMAMVKMLAQTDRAAIEFYVRTWDEARKARLDGNISSYVRCANACMSYLDRFALNPAARAKIKIEPQYEMDETLKKLMGTK